MAVQGEQTGQDLQVNITYPDPPPSLDWRPVSRHTEFPGQFPTSAGGCAGGTDRAGFTGKYRVSWHPPPPPPTHTHTLECSPVSCCTEFPGQFPTSAGGCAGGTDRAGFTGKYHVSYPPPPPPPPLPSLGWGPAGHCTEFTGQDNVTGLKLGTLLHNEERKKM